MMAPPLIGLWAQTNPQGALDYSLTQLRDSTLAVSLEQIARGWARQDPAAAWAWFKQTIEAGNLPIREDTWRWLPQNIFSEWAARDASSALNQLSGLSFPEQQAAIFGVAAAVTEPEARPNILAGLTKLADEGLKRRVALEVVEAWARLEPEAAARWAEGLTFANPGARMHILGEVAEEWWPVDPHATARWLLANAPAEFRDFVASLFANTPQR